MLEEKKEQFTLGEEDLEQVFGAGDEIKEDFGDESLVKIDGPKALPDVEGRVYFDVPKAGKT